MYNLLCENINQNTNHMDWTEATTAHCKMVCRIHYANGTSIIIRVFGSKILCFASLGMYAWQLIAAVQAVALWAMRHSEVEVE